MIEIKRNGKVFYTLEDVCEGSKLSRQLMDHHYIILKFTTVVPVYFEIGDSVEIPDFGYFELTSAYFPKQGDNGGYEYELQLDAYYMAWKNKICKYRPQYGANETSFSLTTTVGVHMNVVLGNLKALGLKFNGKDFTVDYTTYNKDAFDVEKRFLVSYDSVSILDAITSIAETLECEWWIDGSIIYLGTCEMVGQVTFELGVNVKSMSFSESKASYITRLYAFGSDKNIPKGYFTGSETDVTTDGIATDYLMLPTQEEDEDGFVAKDGHLENVNVVKNPAQAIEGVVMFNDEYPKVECAVSGIKTYDSTVKNDDGTTTTQTFWQVTSNDSFATSFEKAWIKENLTLMIKFTSGALLGMEFEVAYKIIDKKNYFEIVANETYGRSLPDKYLCPKSGDKFFLYNWDSTKITDTDLIQKARLSLLERAKTYYKKSMISNANFDCEMDAENFYNDGTYDYHPLGEQVKLINPMFADVDKNGSHYRNSRIIGMEINLDIPYDAPTYIVGEKAAYSKLGQLEDKVDSITVNGMQIGSSGSGGGVYVIGLNDSTPATDSNVYSARRIRNDFLSKISDDTVQGIITFLKGLKVGNTGNYEITADGLARLFAFMTANFNSGLYGQGASIDDKGAAELDSLFVRKFVFTPKFAFNEISVTMAEQWNTNGYGTIESVDTTKRQITLKLEENDYGSLSEGDICRGIYADIDNSYGSDSIEEGALDDCNFVTHKGFFTTYFYVRRIITAEKGKFVFEYGKRNRNTPDPCAFMDFAQYGSFTDKDRMSSMYFCSRGRSYIEVLDGVKTWEVQVENRVARYGYLGNLRVKRKDGTYIDLKGNGLFAQNNVYFGDNIFRLENISNLDELENLAASYDVTLSQYQSVLTIDDMGNVINGLYTEDEGKTTKQYRVSTAVFVRKGNNILLEEDENNEDVTEGHYRLHVVSAECTCEVQNSTVFITGINNIKDGVLGSDDDDNFDYDAMRKMTDCMVTIVVDLEGKTSKVVQMPIRIQHDSLPFMVCDLTNEHASVSWHTKHKHYAGLPIETTVNMFYKNEPYEFGMRASLPKEVSDYLEVSVADSGKSKVLTIDKKADFSSDVLPTSFEVGIYCVSDYAGAKYEYTKKLSVSKTADAVIYEIVPSANSVSVNSKNEVSPSSVGCEVWATSSDDKRYQVTSLPDGYSLAYQKDGGTLYAMQLGAKIAVAATDKEIAFVLKHTENGVTYVDDKEGVPVVKDGKGGMMALCSDNMVSVSVDVNGKVAAALNSTLSFRLFAGEKELSVSGISINASPTSKVVTGTVSGNTLNLSCDVGADFGKYDMSYIIKVDGKDGSVSYSSYVSVKVVPNVLGKGMVSVNTWYALGDSATDKPSDSDFTYDTMGAAVIESNADKYLWSGDKITYSDRSTAFTGIYLVGKCSELASVTEQYAKTTTAAEPTEGWADTYPSSVAKGDYIWSRDKITWKNGSVSYSAAQLAGYIGVDGKGYEYVYYLASENKTPAKPSRRAEATLTGGWTDSIPSMDSSHGYIFVSCRQGELFAESSQDEWSTPVLYARLPKQIDSVNTWYGLSSSITTLPSSYSYDKMSDAVIKDNADKYLWSADKVAYSDGTSEYTGAYCVGKCSELASIKEQYGTSTSSTTKPTSWSDTYPSNLTKGTYIWTRDFITWKNGSTGQTEAQLAGYISKDGKGIDYVVTKYYTYSSDSNGNPSKPSASNIWSYGTTTMPTDFNDSYPWLWALTRTYYTDGTYDDSEPYCIGYKGKNGDKGEQGDQGVSVVSVTTYYLISSLSSGVSTSTSGWTTSMVNPTYSKPYLWSYTKTTLSNGNAENSTPVIIGNFAEAGPMGTNGCIVRNSIWKSGVEYRNDSALTTDGVKYLDYVYVENSNATYGWDMYLCKTTHTSASYNSPTGSYSSTYWTKLSDVGPIYTPFILAKNAVLNFAQSQQLNLMNENDIWGSIRNPSGSDGDESKWALWLGGSTASSAPFRVDKDGNAYLNSGVYEGSMRSPFKGIGAGFDNILTDNISTVGVTNVNFVNPKLDYVGRLVHFVNHRWNGSLQSGTTTLKLPSGYYFYEDGVTKSSIQVSRECVTLLGLGDESRFYGWLVLDRVDIETEKKYGHDMKVLAYGQVTGVTSGTPSIRYKTFNGSAVTVSRSGTGIYRIGCPSSWFGNDTSNVFVQLTGIGYSLDSSKKTEPIKATLWSVEFSINTMFITVRTSDDETVNDGSFNFTISNFDDFSYLS